MCLYLTWGWHVAGFRDTGRVCTDTSYVTHSRDKDGWESAGIFALISQPHHLQTSVQGMIADHHFLLYL